MRTPACFRIILLLIKQVNFRFILIALAVVGFGIITLDSNHERIENCFKDQLIDPILKPIFGYGQPYDVKAIINLNIQDSGIGEIYEEIGNLSNYQWKNVGYNYFDFRSPNNGTMREGALGLHSEEDFVVKSNCFSLGEKWALRLRAPKVTENMKNAYISRNVRFIYIWRVKDINRNLAREEEMQKCETSKGNDSYLNKQKEYYERGVMDALKL